jgi:hypothetical protein
MKLNPPYYIHSLQVRIDNHVRRNHWRSDIYLQMIDLNDRLNIIRHDFSNGEDVNNKMLSLNRKLITLEKHRGSQRFIRSAQSRATRFFGGNHVNG